MKVIKEACVESYAEAKRAAELGADRVELCDNLAIGGTTPSYGTIKLAKGLDLEVFPIIRPRGGGFVYTEEELQIMEADLDACREIGVDGVVFGVLTEDNQIDVPVMKRLMARCGNLQVAFHLAFEQTPDTKKALDILADLGVIRTLTNGSRDRSSALNNQAAIRTLVEYSAGRVILLPAIGVTKDNYEELVKNTGVTEVHGTKIVGDLT